MGVTSRLQKKIPGSVKKIYYQTVPFSYRYEKTYRNTLETLKANLEKDTAELLEEQRLKFLELVKHCAENVPFYRNYFNEHGLSLKDFNSVGDITKLPVINKKIINANLPDFLDERHIGRLIEFKTSGSTGEKFIFKGTDAMFKQESAFVTRAYQAHGSNLYEDWSIWIRRYVPESADAPLFKKDFELRRLYMSAYHLNNESVHQYVDIINKHKYETISTYPSSAYSLACLLEEENLRFLPGQT